MDDLRPKAPELELTAVPDAGDGGADALQLGPIDTIDTSAVAAPAVAAPADATDGPFAMHLSTAKPTASAGAPPKSSKVSNNEANHTLAAALMGLPMAKGKKSAGKKANRSTPIKQAARSVPVDDPLARWDIATTVPPVSTPPAADDFVATVTLAPAVVGRDEIPPSPAEEEGGILSRPAESARPASQSMPTESPVTVFDLIVSDDALAAEANAALALTKPRPATIAVPEVVVATPVVAAPVVAAPAMAPVTASIHEAEPVVAMLSGVTAVPPTPSSPSPAPTEPPTSTEPPMPTAPAPARPSEPVAPANRSPLPSLQTPRTAAEKSAAPRRAIPVAPVWPRAAGTATAADSGTTPAAKPSSTRKPVHAATQVADPARPQSPQSPLRPVAPGVPAKPQMPAVKMDTKAASVHVAGAKAIALTPPGAPVRLSYAAPEIIIPAASTGAWWTIPLTFVGIAIVACAVLIPASDENRRDGYELAKIERDVSYFERQSAVNQDFLKRVDTDPTLAERLAMRQLHQTREGAKIAQLSMQPDRFGASPYAMTRLDPPAPMPAYAPVPGKLGEWFLGDKRPQQMAGLGLCVAGAGVLLGGLRRRNPALAAE